MAKTPSGIAFFDEHFGGVIAGRGILVCGRKGTGKTTIGLQFVARGLCLDERCAIFSTRPVAELADAAAALGFSWASPIERRQLLLLDAETYSAETNSAGSNSLPPESFDRLRGIIDANDIRRVLLDTILPWVAIPRMDIIAERTLSFVRSFERMGVTAMMTLPKPVSPIAHHLKKALDEVIPISILLDPAPAPLHGVFHVIKYPGATMPSGPFPYAIERGIGIAPAAAKNSS